MYETFDAVAFQDEFISLKQIKPLEWTNNAFEFTITHNSQVLKQPIWFSHLTMLGLLKTKFSSILDIGSGDGMASWIFKFLDKEVTSLEPEGKYTRLQSNPGYQPDYTNDYMDVTFNKKFDAIWCSHVLEHIRNTGNFLDKIFNDLNEGGILALTVPFNDMTDDLRWCCFGHYTKYTHSLLVYQLISSGFDCSDIHLANYDGQIGVILRKKSNNLKILNTGYSGPTIKNFLPKEMEYADIGNGTWSAQKYYNWDFPKLHNNYDLPIFKKM